MTRAEQVELIDRTSVDVARDAKLLALAPRDMLLRNRVDIEEARELLSDALAKVERDAA